MILKIIKSTININKSEKEILYKIDKEINI